MEYLANIENTVWLRELAEYATIFISIFGIIIALRHGCFFSRSQDKTSIRIRRVFVTDALIYAVTLAMGIGLAFELKTVVHYDIIIRPLALALNVYASWRLFRHFQKV